MSEGIGFWVEMVQPAAISADPYGAVPVLNDGKNAVAAEGIGTSGDMTVMEGVHFTAVKGGQAAAISPNPEEAGAGIAEGPNLGVKKARGVGRVGEEAQKILSVEVELADAAVGADPEDAVGSEVKRDDPVIS